MFAPERKWGTPTLRRHRGHGHFKGDAIGVTRSTRPERSSRRDSKGGLGTTAGRLGAPVTDRRGPPAHADRVTRSTRLQSNPMYPTPQEAIEIRTRLMSDLQKQPIELFLAKHLFETMPWCFGAAPADELWKWRVDFSKAIGVDQLGIHVVGSGCTGVSLSPTKNLKAFDVKSDIDVAVISSYYFEQAWAYLQDPGRSKYDMNKTERDALDDQRNRHVFWGCIATDKIIQFLPFGREWTLAASAAAKKLPTKTNPINIRLYRNTWSLVSYQKHGLLTLQREQGKDPNGSQ